MRGLVYVVGCKGQGWSCGHKVRTVSFSLGTLVSSQTKGHTKANIVSKENDIYNLFHNCKKQSLNLYEGIGF